MPNYIRELRERIGQIPIVAATASVVVLDGEGRILLQRRSDDGTWGLPGGYVELGESVEETAARELLEETGLTARNLEFFKVYSGKELYNKYPNGDETWFVDSVFLTRNFTGKLTVDGDESLDLRFFSPDSLPETISPSNLPTLRDVLVDLRS
jgi:8-oxo-dGTP pyrophosphatase MutT (NUDIX family)